MAKSDDDMADGIDLSALFALYDVSQEEMQKIAADSGSIAIAKLGVDDKGSIVNQVYDYSVDYANSRAAELVGKKWVNGVLVDNPNADWSIPDATRDELRGIIMQAFDGTIKPSDLEDAIQEAGAFSPARAELIARTEVTRANSYGSLGGYKAAKDAGVNVKKAWHPDDEACEICLGNADDGDIDLDDSFSSGDDAPPGHPNCECSIIPVVETENGDEEEGDEE